MTNHIRNSTISLLSLLTLSALFSSCASAQKETVTSEKKRGGVTVIHHRSKTSYGARDRIEAINSKGVVSLAEVKVYDVGRLPDGHGGMREAGRYYQIVNSSSFNLALPQKSGNLASGPKTIFTPPNYTAPPNDQRVEDALADAREAKRKLDEQQAKLAEEIAQFNVKKGELQNQIERTQQIADQLKASFNTETKPKKEGPKTEAEKAAESVSADNLADWGRQVDKQ
jgi:hypothetical protein